MFVDLSYGLFSSVLLPFLFSMVLTGVSAQAGAQGCPFSASLPEGFVRYENPSYGVAICYPSMWQIVQENTAVGTSASDNIVVFNDMY